MNERIKQLWKQSGGHYDSGNQHTWPEYTIDDPKKFAELIVRECAKIIETQDVDPSFKNRMSWAIKKHFGVEE